MNMLVKVPNFSINISDREGRATVLPIFKRKLENVILHKAKIPVGGDKQRVSDVRTSMRAIYPITHPLVEKIKSKTNIMNEILDKDEELDIENAGREIKDATSIFLDEDNQLCYNFVTYELKFNREGQPIPCSIDGQIYCKHTMIKEIPPNINAEVPVTHVNFYIDYQTAVRSYIFDSSYQIRHKDNLTYDFLYNMAKDLYQKQKMALLASVVDGKIKPLVMRYNGNPFWAFIEGKVDGKKYALILHKTLLKLT